MSDKNEDVVTREGQEPVTRSRSQLADGGLAPLILICGQDEFCSEARWELERRRKDLRLAATDGLASGRRFLEEMEVPTAILAEERALVSEGVSLRQRREALAAALLLADYAPVVWIGTPEDNVEISAALRFAPVDFVPRSPLWVPAALNMLERRLRMERAALSLLEGFEERDFGQILRRELNNPLTGILGNAELLLLEARRGKLQLAPHTLQLLETIAELAVRMREAVRQLSDRWESTGSHWTMEKGQTAGR